MGTRLSGHAFLDLRKQDTEVRDWVRYRRTNGTRLRAARRLPSYWLHSVAVDPAQLGL